MRCALVMRAAEKVVDLCSLIGNLHASDVARRCMAMAALVSSKLSWLPFAASKLHGKLPAVHVVVVRLFQSQCPMSTGLAPDDVLVSVSAKCFRISS